MRLFIAIPLPKEIKDYIYDLEKEINSNYAKIRWVHKKNLHLTLKFIGDISEDKAIELENRLNNIKFNPFNVRINKLGTFPNMNNPNVIWVDFEPDNDLLKLQQSVDEEILDLFPSSEQKFINHVTLGRVKLIKKKNEFIKLLNSVEIKHLEFKIDSFSLIKSELTKDGPIYRIIKNF